MEYKLTFADGSEAYLEHHGVKGMKWGVRNAETLAKYQHSGRAKRATKSMDKLSQKIEANLWRGNDLKAARYSQRLAAKQIKYHSKEAKAGGDAALKGPGSSIRRESKAAQEAYNKYNRKVNAVTAAGAVSFGVPGALVARGAAMSTKKNKELARTYNNTLNKYANTNLAAARAHVERGKKEIEIVKKAQNEGRLVAAVPTGNGVTYVTKSEKK